MASAEARLAAVEERVRARLTRLAASDRPIVAGPWTGEVGFELVYWIPFLQWAVQAFAIDRRRVIAVSRGGVRSWYRQVAADYADVFEHVSPERFHAATPLKKQIGVGRFDRAVARDVMRSRGIARTHLLPPALMYRLYKALWRLDPSGRGFDAFARSARIAPEADEAVATLPRDYVAMRFYFSTSFPDTPENRAFAADAIADVADRHPVVLLNNDIVLDDHRDFAGGARDRVRTVAGMRPETNLATQTAVIARARAFVGTYGGYSYLAPLCGVPSVAYYSATAFKRHHLDRAQRMFAALGEATVQPHDVAAGELPGPLLDGLRPAIAS